ncbi:hypothetical protein COU20_01375 [Candidatus Kaiserbacteria bacterium CG10_big_fil_rev_8_21_14_0_10_59_10]|uniref:Capsule synthesis protein CapA domain-containing protein n=1 Tax=Candidatus Kaiserbacteria bacterium CG10_big_fil_rev_8_21_14_0_10_59_10 TaxID=1974612 RepID=A0A2H0UA74_9BACT|nr:MAG: hypothetical protein COU20_01375 [Candidatus Kaiserbacteria bacterium CG10_big_fil_rev_8_21_14_0_10_59_10]
MRRAVLLGVLAVACFAIAGSIAAALFVQGASSRALTYAARFLPGEKPPEAVVLFAGDMMFDRAIRIAAQRHREDYIFSCIADVLREADIVVGNLEGPITSRPSMSAGSIIDTPENYTFTFPTTTGELLARHNVRLVHIGNNHTFDMGGEGLAETRHWLEAASVAFFGDPENKTHYIAREDIGGVPLSFVGWNDWYGPSREETLAQIAAEAAAGRVVVAYAHWGEEYVPATERQKELARDFVDAGAQLVIGSHPHVIQEDEIYKGAHIYYSLGNFIFDQYWEDAVRTGLLVRVTFSPAGVEHIEEIPVWLERDRRTCPLAQ